MRCTLSLLFLIFASLGSHAAASPILPQACLKACASAFGKKLGSNQGVIGYSNCNPDCESDLWNTIKIGKQPVKTGMQWQCVEYARRWYMQQLGYTFASIDHAYQIWDLVAADKLGSEEQAKWMKFANGKTKEQPHANDLLIYNKKQGVHGHVSVIVKVTKGFVYIAEQNYANSMWKSGNYARKVSLRHDKKGNYTIKDLGVIGWMRLNMDKNLLQKKKA